MDNKKNHNNQTDSDSESLVGAHASIAKGFLNAVKSIEQIGGNSIQIFLKSPRGKVSKKLDELEAEVCKSQLSNHNIFLVGHCSYLLNFAKNPQEDNWATQSLIEDLNNIHKLGGVGVVLHIGKMLSMDKQTALNNILSSVSKVLENTPKETKVIFENTAGQGTEMGYKLEELAEIYNLFSQEQKKRIFFCIDTCHAFVAGYDLRTKESILKFQKIFDKLIGWEKIICMHFNDTKKDLGSRVDRHQDIGHGFIGEEGLKEIAILANESKNPLILETTTQFESYKEQLNKIKSWLK